jgi:simple sugar transport system ATP-binding protein
MLAEMMVGRKVILMIDKEPAKPGETILRVDHLKVQDDRHATTVHDVSFEVREGEILGIAGVQGNGQREVVEALTGLRPVVGGKVILTGHAITHAKPREVTAMGTGHVPEDRHKHGLVLSFPVRDNLVLCTYYEPPFARGIEINEVAIESVAQKLVDEFDIRTPSTGTTVSSLSGGNQQKVIVARELNRPVKLLIANQPTRGLDVGSIEFIHRRIVEARDRRTAVLLVSAELDEIMSLSDRIAVMYKGRILDTLDAGTATREQLGLLMAGVQGGAHV